MAKEASLQEMFVEEMRDLLDAEKQLVRALPKMAKAASDEELGNALREHAEVTNTNRVVAAAAVTDGAAREPGLP